MQTWRTAKQNAWNFHIARSNTSDRKHMKCPPVVPDPAAWSNQNQTMRWSSCGSSFAELICPAWETHCLLKHTGFGPAAVCQKRISCETSKHGSGTLPLLWKVTLQFPPSPIGSSEVFFLFCSFCYLLFSSNLVITICKDFWISATRKFLNYNTHVFLLSTTASKANM